MAALKPYLIAGSNSGLELDKKPFLLPDDGFPTLENAYVWRDRVKKREGLSYLGRLRRALTGQDLGTTSAGDTTNIANIFTTISITGENAEIAPGTLMITVAAPDTATFSDNGDGTFTVTGKGSRDGSYVNYATGEINLMFDPVATGGAAITANIGYFPGLPAMGMIVRERSNQNFEQTLIWDTRYCYAFDGTNFNEYLPSTATTWNGSNSQFFSGANFRGSDASVSTLFVTNFNLDAAGNPIRYTDGATWTDLEPFVASTQVNNEALGTVTTPWTSFSGSLANANPVPGTVTITVSNGTDPTVIFTDVNRDGTLKGAPNTNSGTIDYDTLAINLTLDPALTDDADVVVDYKYGTNKLFSCRQLIPYYGRLLAFYTFEGASRASSKEYYNRVRFSQIGDPTQTGAWDSTIFGRGGFIDAPTSQRIISVTFFKNTLIVYFERSTWQLRYVGDYGIPFVWERISSDFGSDSQFSSLLFDEGVLTVGNRAIVSSTSQSVERIDLKIPDVVFSFRNESFGTRRVHGIRDFQRELAFWSYVDANNTDAAQIFPNYSLVFNYRNNTWARFRNNITCYGTYYDITGVSWDSTTTYWDDYETTWDDVANQTEFPLVICANQQGYVHKYGYTSQDEKSLSITAIDRSGTYLTLTIKNHNLMTGDLIYLENIVFINTANAMEVTNDLNDTVYEVRNITDGGFDTDRIEIGKWDTSIQSYDYEFDYIPAEGSGTYVGGGTVRLLPRMNIATKDFNPFMKDGRQMKLGYVDFLTDAFSGGQVSINLYADTTSSEKGNLIVGQQEMRTNQNPLFKETDYDIYWNRFFSTLFGQFISLQITYDDDQMNDIDIVNQTFVLNAMILWTKPGGRLSP